MTRNAAGANRPGATAWQTVKPYWGSVSTTDPVVCLTNLEQLPEPVKHLYALYLCDFEVCNGVFHQFFSNTSGILAPESAEGFRAVGLHECAKLVEDAVGKFEEPYPRDRDARWHALQEIERPGETREEWDPFYELDDRYYAAKDKSQFYERLDDYARRMKG